MCTGAAPVPSQSRAPGRMSSGSPCTASPETIPGARVRAALPQNPPQQPCYPPSAQLLQQHRDAAHYKGVSSKGTAPKRRARAGNGPGQAPAQTPNKRRRMADPWADRPAGEDAPGWAEEEAQPAEGQRGWPPHQHGRRAGHTAESKRLLRARAARMLQKMDTVMESQKGAAGPAPKGKGRGKKGKATSPRKQRSPGHTSFPPQPPLQWYDSPAPRKGTRRTRGKGAPGWSAEAPAKEEWDRRAAAWVEEAGSQPETMVEPPWEDPSLLQRRLQATQPLGKGPPAASPRLLPRGDPGTAPPDPPEPLAICTQLLREEMLS